MSELTATVAETRANFSKIAATVNATGRPVTVFRNSKPWVLVAPVGRGYGDRIPNIDWSKQDVVRMDEETRKTTLPAEWDDPEDDGLYDDLA
ncbi:MULTISPECIES: type II toxin-antitoxin system Phd/YefM family antitoxin [unclassified Adlercreutzia]|uniref:type II toxin-antitoxin system Phd/YefM family antitoxin n=1 Tax=unclassified Adlercreutzia TaxID=2636013 RepID=UPI0013ECF24E|nr:MULTISPECIES: type II toxin-antitoxin system Phd/YefM family antitoxin [unclassified Adlercreutzia]